MHSRVHSAVLIKTIRIPPVKKSYPDLTKKRLYHVHSLPKNTVCDEFLGVPDSDLKPKTLISTHQKSWKSPLCLRKIRFVLVPFMELVKYQSVGSSAIYGTHSTVHPVVVGFVTLLQIYIGWGRHLSSNGPVMPSKLGLPHSLYCGPVGATQNFSDRFDVGGGGGGDCVGACTHRAQKGAPQ